MPSVICRTDGYHSLDPWNDNLPVHVELGGIVSVSEEKAAQMLRDFPDWFVLAPDSVQAATELAAAVVTEAEGEVQPETADADADDAVAPPAADQPADAAPVDPAAEPVSPTDPATVLAPVDPAAPTEGTVQ